jgi:hypothetical protein
VKPLLLRAMGSRWHASGARHSRMVENSMAAAKIAKTIMRFGMLFQDNGKASALQALYGRSNAQCIPFVGSRIQC